MNIGVVGTGMMIEAILPVFESMPEINVAAIYGRNSDAVASLAERYDLGNVYTDYGEFLGDCGFDVVYIALVNDLHYEFSLGAFNAGKHVILEKPLTVNLRETLELVRVAKEKKLLFLEAITTIHLPNYIRMREALEEIGPVKLVMGNFSQYSSRYDEYKKGNVIPSFDPKHYGGALTDMNIYNIHATVGLFGKPDNVAYFANNDFNNVDTSGSLIMQYEGFTACLSAAKDSLSPCFFTVQGENGFVSTFSSSSTFDGLEISIRNGESERIDLQGDRNRLTFEFLEFVRIYENLDFAGADKLLAHCVAVM